MKAKTKAPEQTFEEARYLQSLVQSRRPVCLVMRSGERLSGIVEFYDASFLRLTRDGDPNLFVFKHDIKYLYEVPLDGQA